MYFTYGMAISDILTLFRRKVSKDYKAILTYLMLCGCIAWLFNEVSFPKQYFLMLCPMVLCLYFLLYYVKDHKLPYKALEC